MCAALLITGGAERTFFDELAARIVVKRLFSVTTSAVVAITLLIRDAE